MNDTVTARVWVGCLACYNEGFLAGEWWDADEAPLSMTGTDDETEHFNAQIDERRVHVSPYHYRDGHEELWVMDHDGFRGWLTGESSPGEGLGGAQRSARSEAGGCKRVVVGAWARDQSLLDGFDWGSQGDEFRDAYRGIHDSLEAYVREFYEETYPQLADLPGAIRDNIDWEGVADDFDELFTVQVGGDLHVFTG